MIQEDNSTSLSIVDSSGRQVSILNSTTSRPLTSQHQSPPMPTKRQLYQQQHVTLRAASIAPVKRKYVCNESGCFKSFTTSGHLSRHYRIHSGEKNFPCLFPNCGSRFSRQDNMMQHYRTHMSPKSRRKKQSDNRSQPRLHAHNRILSDVTAPLTIDQHLRKYHQSQGSPQHTRYQHREPRQMCASGITATVNYTTPVTTYGQRQPSNRTAFSPASVRSPQLLDSSSSSSSTATATATATTTTTATALTTNNQTTQKHVSISGFTSASGDVFYQHRPLIYTESQDTNPTTLLSPAPIHTHRQQHSSLSAASSPSHPSKEENGSAPNSLLQLANIVSSFG